MRIFYLKVSIPGIKRVYRMIEATENCTFDDLHGTIFDAFDRFDSHLYSFFITKSDAKSRRQIWDSPEITTESNVEDPFGFGPAKQSATNTCLGEVGLEEKDIFHYLFDFGDEWWHRIRVESIKSSDKNKKAITAIRSVGESPPQYPDYGEE